MFLPALVPIQSRSLHASNAVILRQAALCCLMMASAPEWRERKESGIVGEWEWDGGQGGMRMKEGVKVRDRESEVGIKIEGAEKV